MKVSKQEAYPRALPGINTLEKKEWTQGRAHGETGFQHCPKFGLRDWTFENLTAQSEMWVVQEGGITFLVKVILFR